MGHIPGETLGFWLLVSLDTRDLGLHMVSNEFQFLIYNLQFCDPHSVISIFYCEDTEYVVMCLPYCSPMLFLDNSDSPSIVEQ